MTADPLVRDLLRASELAQALLVGGLCGLDEVATGVRVWELADTGGQTCDPGDVVIVTTEPADGTGGPAIDVALRRAHTQHAVLVALPHQGPDLPLATVRLADWLGLPTVVRGSAAGALDVVAEVHRLVHEPAVEESRRLLAIASDLGAVADPQDLVDVLRRHRVGDVGIVTADAGLVAGHLGGVPQSRVTSTRRPEAVHVAGTGAVVRPVRLGGPRPDAWLVIGQPAPTKRWLTHAQHAATLAEGPLTRLLTEALLRHERLAGDRARLLGEVLAAPEHVGPGHHASAAELGLTLTGWHVGLHVVIGGEVPERLGQARIEETLVRAVSGLGAVVDRGDGLSAWLSAAELPSPSRTRSVSGCAQAALEGLVADAPGMRVCVGIGSAQRDAVGLARTLAEARHAALVCSTSATDPGVRVVQDLGATRMLLGWYGSGTFRELADDILAPLLAVGDDELERTLAAYLDRSCSASQTARDLGIHRNTVNQRITRAEQALAVTLDDADTRLALQLALRARDEDRPG